LASLMQMPGQRAQRLLELAAAHPLLEAAMAGLERRILLRQLAPLRARAQHPKDAVPHSAPIMPGTATIVRPPRRAQHRLHHLPLFVGQFPASTHRSDRSTPEHLQNAP
jgi:hypothetical protein